MDWKRIDKEFQEVGPLALDKALREGDLEVELRALGLATYIGIRRIQMARQQLPEIDIFDDVFLEALVGEIS